MSKGGGKTITFLREVNSPVHGSFMPGDIGHNVDAQWASDLIAIKAAEDGGTAKQADAAADRAGRLVTRTAATEVREVERHGFQTDAGVARKAAASSSSTEGAGHPTLSATGSDPVAKTTPDKTTVSRSTPAAKTSTGKTKLPKTPGRRAST